VLAAAFFLFPEIKISCFVQAVVASALGKPFGRNKKLQTTLITNSNNGYHNKNGLPKREGIGKSIDQKIRKKLPGTALCNGLGICKTGVVPRIQNHQSLF